MLTGVPKNERWAIWMVFIWVFFSLGPGLLIANVPAFIGYFPVLFVWSLAFFVISVIITYILAYKISFLNVPEDFEVTEENVGRKVQNG